MNPGGPYDAITPVDGSEPIYSRGSSRSSSSCSSSSNYTSTESSDVGTPPLDQPFVMPDSLRAVPLNRSMKRDVLCMVGTPAPAGRADLEAPAAMLTEGRLCILLDNAKCSARRHRFPVGTQQWEDAAAIALYTDTSPVYRIVNGYLSAPNLTLGDVLPVAPMVRRIYEAVQRLGSRYSATAYRVLKASTTEGSVATQRAYANYKVDFAVGVTIDIQQFASFAKGTSTVNAFAKKHTSPVIVLSCGALDGFDISQYSMIPSEGEVLCLPPARFVVSVPPAMIGTTVVVSMETLAAAQKRAAATPLLLFASSLGAMPMVNPSDPQIVRSALLDDVEARLHSHQHCVIYGPKGVGKSHLAHQLGQRWAAKGNHHVRWFSAGSRDLLQADYHTFLMDCTGGRCGGPIDSRSNQPAMQRLIASTPNVLLVFDGVEDEAVVETMLHELFPMTGQPPGVFVLMTSTSSTICTTGAWGALREQHRKEIPVFTDTEVASYLTLALPNRPDDAMRLQCMPLFQVHVHNHPKRLQWVAALLRNKPDMTLDQLESRVAQSVAPDAVDPVFTFVIDALIVQCTESNTKGWEMLRLAATLADAPTPVELLCRAMALSDDEADDAIRSLMQFSLAELTFPVGRADEASTPCIVLHSLAREEATRYTAHYASASLADATAFSTRSLVTSLNALFATSSSMSHFCYPHANIVAKNQLASFGFHEADQLATIALVRNMEAHMYYMGQYATAIEHATQVLCGCCTPHPILTQTDSLSNIGCYYGELGDHKQALQYALEALEMRCKVLPDPHPDIASSLHNIGSHYSALGDHTQALKCAHEALEMRRKVLPDPHPAIASSLHNIGSHYSALGDHTQALKYALEALEIRRKVLHYPHPDIASSLHNIGSLLSALGDHTQALKCAHEALEMRRKVLPDPHPDIASSLHKIGSLLSALGDHTQALKRAHEALEMRRKVLPDPHPDIASSLHFIGSHYSSLGDRKQALQFALEALEMMRKVLPDPHPAIASSLHNIGSHYSALGDHTQALKCAHEALEMRRKVLHYPHPDIASSLHNIGSHYSSLGDHTQALQYALDAR